MSRKCALSKPLAQLHHNAAFTVAGAAAQLLGLAGQRLSGCAMVLMQCCHLTSWKF